MSLSNLEMEELKQARFLLENPGLAAKITNMLGSPIERGFAMLPKSWSDKVTDVTRKSIETALDVALWSLASSKGPATSSNGWHKAAVGVTGAAGGAFGLAALTIELPISTTIILRSIADIARSEGEDLSFPGGKLQCVQVLALGGASKTDDAAETGYFAARAALAQAVSAAATHVAHKGLSATGGPALARVIAEVSARFSINVTEKVAAQAVPVVGAVGGALINTLFISHFQDMGRGHFVIRRLERKYGADEVQGLYEQLGR